jgi:hypothetical protein
MALSIRNRVDTHIHTHIGHNPKELVFRIGDAQGDNKLGRIGPRFEITFTFEHESPSIHATLQANSNKYLLGGRDDGSSTHMQCSIKPR